MGIESFHLHDKKPFLRFLTVSGNVFGLNWASLGIVPPSPKQAWLENYSVTLFYGEAPETPISFPF